MPRIAEQLPDRRMLDDLTGIHDDHPVGDSRDDPKVMRDPDDRHAEFFPQLPDQFENLRLDRDIERRGGFVGDQDFRVAGQRDGDHHPLAHSTRKLVRVVVKPPPGVRNSDKSQQFMRPFARLSACQPHVPAQGFHKLEPDGEHRIQRCHRVLEHETDSRAANGSQSPVVGLEEILPLEQDLTVTDLGGRGGQEAEKRHHRHRLARTGFADNAQKLAGTEIETHGIDRMHLALPGPEHGLEIDDIKYGRSPVRHMESP